MIILGSATHLIDTAIGPIAIVTTELEGMDVDDYVHIVTRSQAVKLDMINAVRAVNTTLTSNRPPVELGGIRVGGY